MTIIPRVLGSLGIALLGFVLSARLLELLTQNPSEVFGGAGKFLLFPLSIGLGVLFWIYSSEEALADAGAFYWRATKSVIVALLGLVIGLWILVLLSHQFAYVHLLVVVVFLVVIPATCGVIVWRSDRKKLRRQAHEG